LFQAANWAESTHSSHDFQSKKDHFFTVLYHISIFLRPHGPYAGKKTSRETSAPTENRSRQRQRASLPAVSAPWPPPHDQRGCTYSSWRTSIGRPPQIPEHLGIPGSPVWTRRGGRREKPPQN